MTTFHVKTDPFVDYLQDLWIRNERGALAGLRRGLGRPPGMAIEMYPHVIPKLPSNLSEWDEKAYYLVAALFALYPASAPEGNMGAHFAALCEPGEAPSPAVERRFIALLSSHPDDLHRTLQQAVSLLKSKPVPICWHTLLRDLRRWAYPESRVRVQKEWADAFWARTVPAESATEETTISEEG